MQRATHSTTRALALFRRFAPYLKTGKRPIALAALLTLILPVTAGSTLWLVKLLVDELLVRGSLELLPLFGGIYVAVATIRIVLDYVTTRLDASIAETVTRDIRISLYRHLVSISPGSLGNRGSGDQLAHLSGDVERTQSLIYTVPLGIFSDLLGVTFFAGFLLLLDWQLTLVALLAAPILAVASRLNAPRVRRAAKIGRLMTSRWFALAEERLGASQLIQAFNAQDRETGRFATRCEAARDAELRTVKIEAWFTLLLELTTATVALVVLGFGAYQISQGVLTVGALVAFLGGVGSLYSPVRGLARASARLQRAAAGAQRVADLLDVQSLVREHPSAKAVVPEVGAIEFRDVSFVYPDGYAALHNLSFSVKPGEVLAIVGPSGSGKSTLINLLLRLYDVSAGRILVGGIDIRDVALSSLRDAVCAVFQESYILQGSIADNLNYGRPTATKDEWLAAANAAYVDSFVAPLASGYRSVVGIRGGRLSGGQRQRLALARSLLRNPSILILDEATAAVDSETEELIHEAIDNRDSKQTLFLVGHRLSSLRRADRVIVLDRGRIVESGMPAALLSKGTRYRDLFAPQLDLVGVAA
ncbi:MAG: ABC transporter ATP-binding protein [Methyloceanibacter sp.]